jgi:hypothetical protein
LNRSIALVAKAGLTKTKTRTCSNKTMNNPKLQTSRVARRILAASALVVCFAFTLVSAQADAEKFLLVSFQENVVFDNNTGTGTLDGKATFAGAFSDKCTRHEDFHVVSVTKDGNPVIAGTSTFTGVNGTLTTSFTGTIYFNSGATQYVEGVESITGGTGIYSGARGKGTFEATQDGSDPQYQVVGVFEVNVK